MTHIALERGRKPKGEVINLFEGETLKGASAFRATEQRGRLAEVARRLTDMLDKLDCELKIDRERAVALLAEYTGLLEIAVEDICRVREIDERFGGTERRVPRIAKLSEKLEKGLGYLVGIFSIVGAGENLPPFSWKLVERDVQMVLGMARSVNDELIEREEKAAA